VVSQPAPKIGSTVQRLRLSSGLTQQHVAELARIAPETLSRIERNRVAPSLEVVGRLAAALRVRPSDLFSGEPKPRKGTLRRCDREWLALVRDSDEADVHDMIRAVRLLIGVRRGRVRRPPTK
jgi:transcriptional regulator with XRE-family HTH domain